MLAQKIKIAYPIFLVIAGLGISFIPGVPLIKLNPDLIFTIFLPPLLYDAAMHTSWKNFWKWKRPIALLGFGLVFFTSLVVAFFTKAFIPGFTLALGFLLGGIVSPPDAIAATTVLKSLKVPQRILTILEGESLINDAASLIVFRFALAAITTGAFSVEKATGQFFLVAIMGIVVGILIGHIFYVIHRFLPTTPAIDATLSILTPYIMFLTAEHFEFSGVLAVVSGGLFISFRSHELFQTGHTRINMLGVWTTIIFIMNALVFVLIGLELPDIVNTLGEDHLSSAIKYGLIISVLVIVIRLIWIYPSTFIPRWLSPKARLDPSPGWKGPFLISWAGMRGVISLATALSIPLMMPDDTTHFPHRSLILFITFTVIFVTLVLQGLTLPLVLRWLQLKEIDPVEDVHKQQASIQAYLHKITLDALNAKYPSALKKNKNLLQYAERTKQKALRYEQLVLTIDSNKEELQHIIAYRLVLLDLFKVQREALFQLRQLNLYNESELRKAEIQIDLSELKITGVQDH
jgi:Na+/H+ antiporter